MNRHGKLNYAEFASRDLVATRRFFEQAFGWRFTDYGPDYIAFDDQGIEGGFHSAPEVATTGSGAPLLIFFSERLEETQAAVEAAGGIVVKPVFSFPGGRRFQFLEPGGNELAVWSDR